MNCITFNDVLNLNENLKQYGYLLILKDMCAGQVVSIRNLNKEKVSDIPKNIYEIIESYFKMKFIKLEYNEGKTSFLIV